jgi:hypothetical protein
MTTSVRIAAPSTSSLATPLAASDRARSFDNTSSMDPPDDFRSVMEKHSGNEAEPQTPASRRQPGNSGGSQGKSAQTNSASQPKDNKDPGKADPAQAVNDSAPVDVSQAQATPAPRPYGPMDLSANMPSANLPANAPPDALNHSDFAETLFSSGDDTQGDSGTPGVGASSPQRSAAANSGPGAPAGFRRSNASAAGNPASLSSGMLLLNLQPAEVIDDEEDVAGAAQTGQASNLPGAAQNSSAQSGTSQGHGLDSNELRAEVSASAAPSSDPVAFEAKLTPASSAVTGNNVQSALPQSVAQAGDQLGSKTLPAPPAAETTAPAESIAARTETLFAAGNQATASLSGQTSHAEARVGADAAPAAERMQPLIEAPAPLTGSHHSITVKVPGGDSSTGIDLRFVERGGDIHLSVRTPSADLAQELRGGLNDLAGRLEHAGIRTEISSPAAGQSSSQDSSPGQSKDQNEPDGRGFSRNSGDSQSQQQELRGSNRSRWMAALADSNQFSQEQTL